MRRPGILAGTAFLSSPIRPTPQERLLYAENAVSDPRKRLTNTVRVVGKMVATMTPQHEYRRRSRNHMLRTASSEEG